MNGVIRTTSRSQWHKPIPMSGLFPLRPARFFCPRPYENSSACRKRRKAGETDNNSKQRGLQVVLQPIAKANVKGYNSFIS